MSHETESDNNSDVLEDDNEIHEYKRKLRSYSKNMGNKVAKESEKVLYIYSITETLLETEFYDYD